MGFLEESALRAGGGDGEARALLVSLFRPLVLRWAFALSGRGVEVEDLVQEGFRALLELSEEFDPGRGVPFPAFVKAVLPGRMRERARREWERRKREVNAEVRRGRACGDGLFAWELRKRLDPVEAKVLEGLLRGLSEAEIGEKLGISRQAVNKRKRRMALKMLDLLPGARERMGL